jgi:hypothetical protein
VVNYISDKAETDVNNIVTYKVEIAFDSKDSWAKEWFTTQIAFDLIRKTGVLSIPIEAIKEEWWVSKVTLLSKQTQSIKTWINDWNYMEVAEWLKEWDIIRY